MLVWLSWLWSWLINLFNRFIQFIRFMQLPTARLVDTFTQSVDWEWTQSGRANVTVVVCIGGNSFAVSDTDQMATSLVRIDDDGKVQSLPCIEKCASSMCPYIDNLVLAVHCGTMFCINAVSGYVQLSVDDPNVYPYRVTSIVSRGQIHTAIMGAEITLLMATETQRYKGECRDVALMPMVDDDSVWLLQLTDNTIIYNDGSGDITCPITVDAPPNSRRLLATRLKNLYVLDVANVMWYRTLHDHEWLVAHSNVSCMALDPLDDHVVWAVAADRLVRFHIDFVKETSGCECCRNVMSRLHAMRVVKRTKLFIIPPGCYVSMAVGHDYICLAQPCRILVFARPLI